MSENMLLSIVSETQKGKICLQNRFATTEDLEDRSPAVQVYEFK